MGEYAAGTILEDEGEDRWLVEAPGFVRALWGSQTCRKSIEDIEGDYGPLTVVDESPKSCLDMIGTARDRLFATEEGEMREFVSEVPQGVIDKARTSSGDAFPSDAFKVYDEAFNILLKKNADYGPSNIADSPGGPLNGILVRMWDKMSRLRHLVESGVEPENESLRDTLMDMANYSLIAMIVLDGNWPGMDDQ